MKLRLKPATQNAWPIRGALLRGSSPRRWLVAMQESGISLARVQVFPLPGLSVNSVWGCLLVPRHPEQSLPAHSFPAVQQVAPTVYISAHSQMYPPCRPEELDRLFPKPVLIHPELGTIPLSAPLEWSQIIQLPETQPSSWQSPAKTVSLPTELRSIRLEQTNPEQVLTQLVEGSFPKQKQLSEEPLSAWEKLRLSLYQLFNPTRNKGERSDKEAAAAQNRREVPLLRTRLGKWWRVWRKQLDQQMMEDWESLERRNKQEADRLLDMFEQNMEEALKYAIPLGDGSERGQGTPRSFTLERHNMQLGSSGKSGGTVLLYDEQVARLHQQYSKAAQALEEKGDYTQASFVYLKLLKDYRSAARVLQSGHKYGEAAAIYLKYCHDKRAAAKAYEKGFMTLEAIKLYRETEQYEKAGDLYLSLGESVAAKEEFEIVVHKYQTAGKHFQAGELIRKKIQDQARALQTYLQGWEGPAKDPTCLKAYFEYESAEPEVASALKRIDQDIQDPKHLETWLGVVIEEYRRGRSTQHQAKEMVYQRIAESSAQRTELVKYLRKFHPEDTILRKDTIRFGVKSPKKERPH